MFDYHLKIVLYEWDHLDVLLNDVIIGGGGLNIQVVSYRFNV